MMHAVFLVLACVFNSTRVLLGLGACLNRVLRRVRDRTIHRYDLHHLHSRTRAFLISSVARAPGTEV